MISSKKMDALILCGGLGKRLRKIVKNKQKCMAEISGRPFLDLLINYLQKNNIERIILCTGYMSDTVRKYYLKNENEEKILFSQEKRPLGTAGAIRKAKKLIKSNPFLVLNGDSICKVNLRDFLGFHKRKKALASVTLAKPKYSKSAKDYGTVILDKDQKVMNFREKVKKGKSFVNAGVYLFDKKVVSLIPDNKNYSLEYDLFPELNNKFYGYVAPCPLTDIGTPARYKAAKKNLINN